MDNKMPPLEGLELSRARAASVRRWLIDNGKVDRPPAHRRRLRRRPSHRRQPRLHRPRQEPAHRVRRHAEARRGALGAVPRWWTEPGRARRREREERRRKLLVATDGGSTTRARPAAGLATGANAGEPLAMSPRAPSLSSSAQALRESIFSRLQGRLAKHGADGVPLHLGDTYLPPPMIAREALEASAADWRYGAPAGEAPLLAALAAKLRAANALDWATEANLQVTVGATAALAAAARAIVDPGDEVLCPTPHWPLIRGIVTNAGGVVVEVPLSQTLYAEPRADAAAILEPHITARTAALYVTTPNNPDGKQLGRAAPRAARRAGAPPRSVGARRRGLRGSRLAGAAPVDCVPARHGRAHAHRLLAVEDLRHRRPPPRLRRRRGGADARAAQDRQPHRLQRAVAACSARRWRSSPRRRRAPGSTRRARSTWPRATKPAASCPRRTSCPTAPPTCSPTSRAGRGSGDLWPLVERLLDAGVSIAPGEQFGRAFARHARLCFTAVPPERLRVGLARLASVLSAA